ncbi:MAG: pYEATS domain-containing protein [candidate division Zixibacteria bacterium]
MAYYKNIRPLSLFIIGFILILTISPKFCMAQDIQLANNATYLGEGRYEWTVFVSAEKAVLDKIKYVEYTLHPTFPEPKRVAANRDDNFSISAKGWGEFLLRAKVVLNNGETIPVEYWLQLKPQENQEIITDSPLLPPPPPPKELIVENTSTITKGDRWEWRIYIVADDRTLGEIECVFYILHPAYPEPIREVCEKGSEPGIGFFMADMAWESFTVEVKIRFKDGRTEFHKHHLTSPFPGEMK